MSGQSWKHKKIFQLFQVKIQVRSKINMSINFACVSLNDWYINLYIFIYNVNTIIQNRFLSLQIQ